VGKESEAKVRIRQLKTFLQINSLIVIIVMLLTEPPKTQHFKNRSPANSIYL